MFLVFYWCHCGKNCTYQGTCVAVLNERLFVFGGVLLRSTAMSLFWADKTRLLVCLHHHSPCDIHPAFSLWLGLWCIQRPPGYPRTDSNPSLCQFAATARWAICLGKKHSCFSHTMFLGKSSSAAVYFVPSTCSLQTKCVAVWSIKVARPTQGYITSMTWNYLIIHAPLQSLVFACCY